MTTPEPLDAGFLYSPRGLPAKGKWTPEPGLCRADVSTPGMSYASHQCTRKAKVKRLVTLNGETVEVEYCGLHDPVAVKAKQDARDAVWEARYANMMAAARERKRPDALRTDAVEAVRQIARGHNDPRSLAAEVLAKNGEPV